MFSYIIKKSNRLQSCPPDHGIEEKKNNLILLLENFHNPVQNEFYLLLIETEEWKEWYNRIRRDFEEFIFVIN